MIHCLPIPTPFAVGRVNVYLIEDDPLTLVDTGPNSGKALDELEQALAAHGRKVEDLELIVITHQHLDHQGLAQILARRSGAEVAALDKLVPLFERFAEANEADDTFAEGLMLRHGLSPTWRWHCAASRAPSGPGGRASRSRARCTTATCSSCATGACRSSTVPATPPPTRSSGTRSAASSSPPITSSSTSPPIRSSRARWTAARSACRPS